MTEGGYQVPTGVENPPPLLFWDPLEFTLAVAMLGFGIAANLWFVGVGAAGAVLIGARYLKRGTKRGVMQHALWAHGVPLDSALSRFSPPPERNDFFE